MVDKSEELLCFIKNCQNQHKSLAHWEKWLRPYVGRYITKKPEDENYFNHETREQYWKHFKLLLKTRQALIFLDPDTGLQTGTASYLKKMGIEKYLLNQEMDNLISLLETESVLMVYQHLTRNKKSHLDSIEKKIKQIHSINCDVLTSAYREDDLAFLFVTKSIIVHKKICSILYKYYERSTHKYKSLHSEALQFRQNP